MHKQSLATKTLRLSTVKSGRAQFLAGFRSTTKKMPEALQTWLLCEADILWCLDSRTMFFGVWTVRPVPWFGVVHMFIAIRRYVCIAQ